MRFRSDIKVPAQFDLKICPFELSTYITVFNTLFTRSLSINLVFRLVLIIIAAWFIKIVS